MSDIQAQVEQHLKKWKPVYDYDCSEGVMVYNEEYSAEFKGSVVALLRQVVEECLEAICEEEAYIAIDRIKREFAWLPKGE